MYLQGAQMDENNSKVDFQYFFRSLSGDFFLFPLNGLTISDIISANIPLSES